jgi:hypothetical protein
MRTSSFIRKYQTGLKLLSEDQRSSLFWAQKRVFDTCGKLQNITWHGTLTEGEGSVHLTSTLR